MRKHWSIKRISGRIYTVEMRDGVIANFDKSHQNMTKAEERLKRLNKLQVGGNRKTLTREQQRGAKRPGV